MISHDIFVVLDVMWLAGVLKPILDHRGVITSRTGEKVGDGLPLSRETMVLVVYSFDSSHSPRFSTLVFSSKIGPGRASAISTIRC